MVSMFEYLITLNMLYQLVEMHLLRHILSAQSMAMSSGASELIQTQQPQR
jgi:hypothetical protein